MADPLPHDPLPPPSTTTPSWDAFFDSRRKVAVPSRSATFNVYQAGSTGPVVFCLHGGGYSGLTWALMASHLKDSCRVVAPDLRGHGATATADDADLSASTLAEDVAALWETLFLTPNAPENDDASTSNGSPSPSPPPTVLVGHSMGGAVAVRAAALTNETNNKPTPRISSLEGVVVIDVVEGTALASLPFMQGVLARRPASFPDPQAAVEWAMETGFARNAAAAALSVPSMLRERSNTEREGPTATSSSINGPKPAETTLDSILEDAGWAGLPPRPPAPAPRPTQGSRPALKTSFGAGGAWVWRTPLGDTAKYWEGWYSGLSSLFLSLKVPKVLVLAGTDRLDKELLFGQMQGKFQLVLLPRAGHAVHEDEPAEVAAAVAGFLKRYRVGCTDKTSGLPGMGIGPGGSLFRTPDAPPAGAMPLPSGPGPSRFKPPTDP